MGTIRKQGIHSTIIIYLAFILGGLNTLYLFPAFFDREAYGLYNLYINFATLFATLATMGILNTLVKFYPIYNSYLPRKKNDLPTITVSIVLIGCLLFLAFGVHFKWLMIQKFSHKSRLFIDYYPWLLPMTITFSMFSTMEVFCWMIKKTVIANFTKEMVFRIYTTLLILLYIFKIITLDTFFKLFTFLYLPGLMILLFVNITSKKYYPVFQISNVSKRLHRKIQTFTLFHFSGTFISILPKTVDMMIIASFNGLAETGVFALATNITAIMEVPQRSLMGITTATVSEAWKNNDTETIDNIYKRTSLNLMVMGILIFGIIYPNMDNLLRILPKGFELAKPIVFTYGIAKIIDLATGFNQLVLGYSKHWKADFFTNVFMIFITIPINYYCIKHLGLEGAALGYLIGIFLYNSLRCWYIWHWFKVQPFTLNSLKIILLGITVIILTVIIPYMGNVFLDALVRTAFFAGIFCFTVLHYQLSPDFYRLFMQTWEKINPFKKK